MGSAPPELERTEFERRLVSAAPGVRLTEACLWALYSHYQELRRWNRRLSLIGPGTVDAVVERHYGESLSGLELIPEGRRRLLDLGSGAGFPGFVLAAARPDLEVFLVEARQRKWAFLEAARRRAALSCTCLNARVGPGLPSGIPAQIDVLTARAVKLEPRVLSPLLPCLPADSSIVLWAGEGEPVVVPGFEPVRERRVVGSRSRRIVELRRTRCAASVKRDTRS
jgi:16S rRNA (guanine(527)-N(7))-methyltransferase RsmG